MPHDPVATTRSCRRPFQAVVLCAVLLVAAGCQVPAQTFWSPDGKLAGYLANDKAYLIDLNGVVQRTDPAGPLELGKTPGGFAWSADGKAFYFAVLDPAPAAPVPIDTRWRAARPPLAPDARGDEVSQVCAYADGKKTPLFDLPSPVAHLLLSPDGQWLAAVTFGPRTEAAAVYVYRFADNVVYVLDDLTAFGACFTGPHTLAYLRGGAGATVLGDDTPTRKPAELVEVALPDTDDAPVPAPTVLLPLKQDLTSMAWLRPTGDGGLLFTTDGKALFRYARATRTAAVVAPVASALFSPSPDGRRVLVAQAAPGGRSELVVIDADGRNARPLADLTPYTRAMPAWPMWRTADEVTFVDLANPKRVGNGNEPRLTFDLVRYHLGPAGPLEPVAVLSKDWPEAMRATVAAKDLVQTPPAAK